MNDQPALPMRDAAFNVTPTFKQRDPDASPKSRLAVLLLCLYAGWLGLHRFYMGKFGTGILYLFTFGFFGVGWLVDLIRIVSGVARDRDGKRITAWLE